MLAVFRTIWAPLERAFSDPGAKGFNPSRESTGNRRSPTRVPRKVLIGAVTVAVIVAGTAVYLIAFRGPRCRGVAACFTDSVSYIVDGDTLDVGDVRIRLTLVNSPEIGQPGAAEATEFTNHTCPIGAQALVDEDDGQTGGSYGRMVALVFCEGVNLNAELLRTGHAVLVPDFCAV